MPDNKPTAKGFPCNPEDCYVSRHLVGPDFKVHDVMLGTAIAGEKERKDGKLIFFASVQPWLCNALNQSRSAVDAALSRLEKAGWIIKHDGGRKPDGQRAPNIYEVRDHDTFVAANPNSCPPYQFAPDSEEARKFGLQKGGKLSIGPVDDRTLRLRGIDLKKEFRVLAEIFEAMTDEERVQLAQRLRTEQPAAVTITLKKRRATPGRQEAANDSGSLSTVAGQSLSTVSGPSLSTVTGHSLSTAKNLTPDLTQHHTPHLTEPKTGVCSVEEKPFDDEEEIARLQDEMAKYDDLSGKATQSQKSKLRKLLKQHGREVFRAAARAWLADHPWNANTTDPLLALIEGFRTYAKRKHYADQEEARLKAQANFKPDYTIHNLTWAVLEDYSQADQKRIQELRLKHASELTAADLDEIRAILTCRKLEPESRASIDDF